MSYNTHARDAVCLFNGVLSVKQIQNGATSVVVDKTTNPRDGSPALLIQGKSSSTILLSTKTNIKFPF